MLIIYNPEKNLFVLTILRLAMLINIGVLGVRGKRGGFCDCGIICTGIFWWRRFWDCTARKKILPKHGQLIKTKKVEKEKNGLYIYIFNILFFFFFLAVFFLSLAGAVECRRRPQPPVFSRVFYFQSIKIHITLLLTNVANIICSTFKS